MNLGTIGKLRWHSGGDFRAKATFGVAIAATLLLLPVALLDFYQGKIAIGIGSLGIVAILSLNAWSVYKGRCHQNLTLYGLVPAGMLFMVSVFQTNGIVGSLWCYPSVLACYCMLSARKAWLANTAILVIALPMTWLTVESTYAFRITATLFAVSMFSAILVAVIDEQRAQLQNQLLLDPLTGLLNRLSLRTRLQQAIEQHNGSGIPTSLLAVDIDHFKRINDRHGHDCGDRVLRQVSHLLKATTRQDDACFRTGGEEFLLLLRATDQAGARQVAERVRTLIEQARFSDNLSVTISIGVASHQTGQSWECWTKSCDNRLYEAKRRGRNTLVDNDVRKTPRKVTHLNIPATIG